MHYNTPERSHPFHFSSGLSLNPIDHDNTHQCDDLCSICLSPFREKSDVLNDNVIIETKCNHCFHKKCYLKVSESKHLCPLCRNSLSPSIKCKPLVIESLKRIEEAKLKNDIISAANRGRNAVR